MTTVGEAPETRDARPDDPAEGVTGGHWLLDEALLTLELVALCAFAFSRPVLDSFGRSPETFAARSADARTIVEFGLVVTLVPIAVVAAIGAITRLAGRRVRGWVHLVLLGALAAVAGWRLAQDITDLPGRAVAVIAAGAVAVPVVVGLRSKLPASRSFLRYAGAASVIFLVQFLFMSPTSALISGDGDEPALDNELSRAVDAALGEDGPPIVFIITDTFPTQAIVDGSGNIDAALFPNLASLAGDGTWYRNSTTVSGFTNEAVPAMLTGLYPKPSETQQFVVPYPNNLFTLFGDNYDLHVHEPMTRLCPSEVCTEQRAGGLGPLLGDAVDLWRGSTRDEATEAATFDIPGLFGDHRFDELTAWIDDQDFSQGGRPDLFFYHAMLPHEPWDYLPDGTVYEASMPPAGIDEVGWMSYGTEVGRQRLVLQAQALDALLGRLFDRMRDADAYDDALVVIAGDHGQSFVPDQPWRQVGESTHEQILWTPLLIKGPGQAEGEISDANVMIIDVLPTIAELLGIDLPFETDGIAHGGPGQRDPDLKYVDDVDTNTWRATDGAPRLAVDGRSGLEQVMTVDPVPFTGEDAVWKRTAHGDLVGRAVSDLPAGDPVGNRVGLRDHDPFDDVDLDAPLHLEVTGTTDAPSGTIVAFALNGRIAAVTEVGVALGTEGNWVQALLMPRLFQDGANELDAYVVEGEVGAEALHPVELDGAG